MLSKQQAIEYLKAMGEDVPEFVLDTWLALISKRQDCLDKHYPEEVITAMLYPLLGTLALSNSARNISSQTSPSGASRSFTYANKGQLWKALVSSIRTLDTHNCLKGLIPANPTANRFAGVWVSGAGVK